LSDPLKARLWRLQQKKTEASALNRKAVKEEHKREINTGDNDQIAGKKELVPNGRKKNKLKMKH